MTSSASITPMSDSGSDSRIASGSRNEPNCTTSTKYISITATPSAMNICVKISVLLLGLAALRSACSRRQRHVLLRSAP